MKKKCLKRAGAAALAVLIAAAGLTACRRRFIRFCGLTYDLLERIERLAYYRVGNVVIGEFILEILLIGV